MRQRRDEGLRRRNQQRETRWREQRLAVPYRTDGPKLTLSLVWFALILSLGYFQPYLLALVVAAVAGIAGLQAGHNWAPVVDRRVTSAVAVVVALSGLLGALGAGVAIVVCVIALSVNAVTAVPAAQSPSASKGRRPVGPTHTDRIIHHAETHVRSSIPAGLAAASLVALVGLEFSAFLALVLLVSAYETGDFLIGTGSANAVEGPIAGTIALIVVSAALYLVVPVPFDTNNFPVFVILAAIAAPVGQVAASAILPRGDSWAPALRRLDSYLIAAPLWLLLLPRL